MKDLLEKLDAEIMSTDFDVSLALSYIERWLRKCREAAQQSGADVPEDGASDTCGATEYKIEYRDLVSWTIPLNRKKGTPLKSDYDDEQEQE